MWLTTKDCIWHVILQGPLNADIDIDNKSKCDSQKWLSFWGNVTQINLKILIGTIIKKTNLCSAWGDWTLPNLHVFLHSFRNKKRHWWSHAAKPQYCTLPCSSAINLVGILLISPYHLCTITIWIIKIQTRKQEVPYFSLLSEGLYCMVEG